LGTNWEAYFFLRHNIFEELSRGGGRLANWNKIKAEYLQGKGTLKELAKKHGVSFSTIQKVSSEENWKKLKKKSEDLTDEQMLERVVKKKSEDLVSINKAADKLIEKIFEMVSDKETPLTPQAVKSLTSALEDLRKTKGYKSELDIEEQRERINKLRREAQQIGADDDDDNTGVLMLPQADAPLIDKEESNA
jgi:uncharacterized protein YjcR